MPQKLQPKVFAGTSVIFFAVVNLLKLPPYFLLNQFSRENLIASLALLPIGIVATYVGVWITNRVRAERFYNVILVLSFVVGVKLVFDSLRDAQSDKRPGSGAACCTEIDATEAQGRSHDMLFRQDQRGIRAISVPAHVGVPDRSSRSNEMRVRSHCCWRPNSRPRLAALRGASPTFNSQIGLPLAFGEFVPVVHAPM